MPAPKKWWIETDADGLLCIGSDNRTFAMFDDAGENRAMLEKIRDTHNELVERVLFISEAMEERN